MTVYGSHQYFGCVLFHFLSAEEEWREDFAFIDFAFVWTAFAAGGVEVSEVSTEWWSRRARLPLRGFVVGGVVPFCSKEAFVKFASVGCIRKDSGDGIVGWL